MEDLGTAAAVRINHFAVAFFWRAVYGLSVGRRR